jgi:hypothetical protein
MALLLLPGVMHLVTGYSHPLLQAELAVWHCCCQPLHCCLVMHPGPLPGGVSSLFPQLEGLGEDQGGAVHPSWEAPDVMETMIEPGHAGYLRLDAAGASAAAPAIRPHLYRCTDCDWAVHLAVVLLLYC